MITAKKLMIIQKVSLLCSVVAMVLSVVAIASISSNCNVKFNIHKENNSFKPIDKIPDVEIIHSDGSVEKIKSVESQDKLGEIITPKKKEENKKEPIARGSQDKKNALKNDKKIIDKEIKKQEIKSVKPTTSEKKVENKVDNASKPQGINGAFVVQVGSFKDKTLAEVQCKKVANTGKLKGKNCAVASRDNSFRAIVYPFDSRELATEFGDKLQRENRISCLVKKNADR